MSVGAYGDIRDSQPSGQDIALAGLRVSKQRSEAIKGERCTVHVLAHGGVPPAAPPPAVAIWLAGDPGSMFALDEHWREKAELVCTDCLGYAVRLVQKGLLTTPSEIRFLLVMGSAP